METPWGHVHLERDEATGNYSLIEFSARPGDVRCPRLGCRAQPGEPCLNLVSPMFHKSPGKRPPIKGFHSERRALAKGQ